MYIRTYLCVCIIHTYMYSCIIQCMYVYSITTLQVRTCTCTYLYNTCILCSDHLIVYPITHEIVCISQLLLNHEIVHVLNLSHLLLNHEIVYVSYYLLASDFIFAEGHLFNPALFTGEQPPCWKMVEEYLELARRHTPSLSFVRGHIFKLWLHVLVV